MNYTFKRIYKSLIICLSISLVACASRPETVYENSKDKVVKIGITTKDMRGSCSGAYIDSFGTVLTCAHCFEHADITKIFVKEEGGLVYRASIEKIDTLHDLCLLHLDYCDNSELSRNIPIFGNFPHFKFGKRVKMGQQVIALGAPLGNQHSMSVGWVENLNHDIISYIIHSAFILPGNSGGPLVNMKGELVGVNEATVMLNFLVPAAGYYVAISVSDVEGFLEHE